MWAWAVCHFYSQPCCWRYRLLLDAVSPSPGLVKLLALSNFRHALAATLSLGWACLTGRFWPLYCHFYVMVYCTVNGAPVLPSWCTKRHGYLPNDNSVPFFLPPCPVHRHWLDSGMGFSPLTVSTAEEYLISLLLIRCCFHCYSQWCSSPAFLMHQTSRVFTQWQLSAIFPPSLSCAPSLTWLRNGFLASDCLDRGGIFN